MAEQIAEGVIGHIDSMYPAMWKVVPSSARRSIRGAIINRIMAEFC